MVSAKNDSVMILVFLFLILISVTANFGNLKFHIVYLIEILKMLLYLGAYVCRKSHALTN